MITFEPTGDGLVAIFHDGQLVGYARDELSAQRTAEEYQAAIQEAASALASALTALWRSYDAPVRQRFLQT